MASKTQVLPLSKLLLDQSNARLGQVQPDQDSTVVALTNKIGNQLIELAQDVIKFSLDPTTLMAVTPEGAPPGKYRVIEGNRRLLALKSLRNPKILTGTNLSSGARRRIGSLADDFRERPIRSIACVVFDTEDEATHWIDLRHTGANQGVGLVEWDSNEKDRYRSRHAGPRGRSLGGQVLDFVERIAPEVTDGGKNRIVTTLQRLVADPDVREILGLGLASKVIYSNFPSREVLKGLAGIITDLRTETIKVTTVYHKKERLEYVQKFGVDRVPDPTTRLADPIPLSELADAEVEGYIELGGGESGSVSEPPRSSYPDDGVAGQVDESTTVTSAAGEAAPPQTSAVGASKSRVKPARPRQTVIPSDCSLWIPLGRLNSIYRELLTLEVDRFPNACAVLLRVFFELSIDHHLQSNGLMLEQERLSSKLTKKIKTVGEGLYRVGKLTEDLRRTVVKIADGTLLGVSVNSMNQYVHNSHSYPSAMELRSAWDEMQPVMRALWVKP